MTAALLRRGILFALLWWILSEGRAGSWGLGAVAVAVALWASVRLLPLASGRISLVGLFAFLGYFIWNSVRGGAQVALIALRGRQALQPDILEMQLSLPSGASRILMVNVLGLMPGTLGVRLEGDRLRLHVLDARMPIAAAVRALEARIAVIFREQS
ncbi:MAG: Na+/H+ antiporter subunit E [Burkholderiales bacterium]|nr:Na+/H+ antiporter subunit E [Burkholderiales bacterium]